MQRVRGEIGHEWFRVGCVILAVGVYLTRALSSGGERSQTLPLHNAFPGTPARCRERGAACERGICRRRPVRVEECLRGSLTAGRECRRVSEWGLCLCRVTSTVCLALCHDAARHPRNPPALLQDRGSQRPPGSLASASSPFLNPSRTLRVASDSAHAPFSPRRASQGM